MKREMSKDSAEYKAFMAIWSLWKNFGTPEDDDNFWDDTIKYASKIANNPETADAKDLVSEISMAILNVIDARHKSIKEFGDEKHGYEILMRHKAENNKRFADKVLREKKE